MPKPMALSMGKDVQNSPRKTLKAIFFFSASEIEFTKSSQIFLVPNEFVVTTCHLHEESINEGKPERATLLFPYVH